MAASAVFSWGTSYQVRAPLTSHSGATATITRSAKLEGALSGIQLDINAFAFTTRKKCLLGVLGGFFFSYRLGRNGSKPLLSDVTGQGLTLSLISQWHPLKI